MYVEAAPQISPGVDVPSQYNIETLRTVERFTGGHAALGYGEVPRGIEQRELLDL